MAFKSVKVTLERKYRFFYYLKKEEFYSLLKKEILCQEKKIFGKQKPLST